MCEDDEGGGISTNFSHEQFEEEFSSESTDEKDEDADEFDAFDTTDKAGECIHSSLAKKFGDYFCHRTVALILINTLLHPVAWLSAAE